jgi:hypothetical protein
MYHVALRPTHSPLVKPVRPLYASYLHDEIIPRFQGLSEDQYLGGPIGILTTAARFSYVLYNEAVNWCIEWSPGLLVINVTSDSMKWAARRSPNPQFGGRSATAAEIEKYEDWEDSWEKQHLLPPPQYGLVFDAWDDIIEESFSNWQSTTEQQSRTVRMIFDRMDELAGRLPKDTNGRAYRELMEEWRRSDFWNMQWENFD